MLPAQLVKRLKVDVCSFSFFLVWAQIGTEIELQMWWRGAQILIAVVPHSHLERSMIIYGQPCENCFFLAIACLRARKTSVLSQDPETDRYCGFGQLTQASLLNRFISAGEHKDEQNSWSIFSPWQGSTLYCNSFLRWSRGPFPGQEQKAARSTTELSSASLQIPSVFGHVLAQPRLDAHMASISVPLEAQSMKKAHVISLRSSSCMKQGVSAPGLPSRGNIHYTPECVEEWWTTRMMNS